MKLVVEIFPVQEKLETIYDLRFEVIFKDFSKKILSS